MNENRSSKEIEGTIKKLDTIVGKLKTVFERAETGEFWFLQDLTYEEVTAFQKELVEILQEYKYFKGAFESGMFFINTDTEPFQYNPTQRKKWADAPAYKKNLDGAAMYQLFKSKVSINEIARRFQCSPDTVKRRIVQEQVKEEQKRKESERFNSHDRQME